jgi:hypothetical protein
MIQTSKKRMKNPFRCRARIVQDTTGSVQEVLVPQLQGFGCLAALFGDRHPANTTVSGCTRSAVSCRTITIDSIGSRFAGAADDDVNEIKTKQTASAGAQFTLSAYITSSGHQADSKRRPAVGVM